MAAKQLRERVTEGVAWSMAEKIGSMLLTVAVRLVILRLLSPDILGCIAIPAAVVAVAMVIADSGFSQNLIRRDNPSPADYKSVFLFNMAVSTGLYVLLTAAAPAVARYYAIPEIAEVAPVFFLLLPVSSLCSVQNAIFTRQFRFALLSKVNFLSSLVSGLAAVGLALAGCGIWSLVGERLLAMAVRAVLLWRLSDWRPRGRGSVASLRDMAPFSVSLMLTDLISTFYMKLPQFFLGKLYPTATLGAFDQAVKLKDMPVTAATQSVQSVTFPALSEVRGDAPKFAESYRQVVLITAYVMFPAMLGLSAVAHDLFALLLSEKWMPTVPYFEVVCLAGLFYPVGMICYNVLKVMSRGPLIVRLEVVKKLLMTVVFAVTIPHSVMAVVWGPCRDRLRRDGRELPCHAPLHALHDPPFPADAAPRRTGLGDDVPARASDGLCGPGTPAPPSCGPAPGRRGGLCGAFRALPPRGLRAVVRPHGKKQVAR